jgi:RNA-binding protein YlmH
MIQNDELKLLLSRADDAVSISENKYMVKVVGFLTPAERAYVEKNVKRPIDGRIDFFGGYDEAERTLMFAVPEYIDDEEARKEISTLLIKARNLSEMSHRDFLGSLMGLGIKREMVGDILVFDDKCIIFIRTEIKEYILSNLGKIGRHGIEISACEVGEIEIPKRQTEMIDGTVAGIRLDSVLSVALKTSRSRAAEYITGGLVSLNWEEIENVSKNLSEGDIISVRGKGRFKVSRIGGLTRKGRYSVSVERYI